MPQKLPAQQMSRQLCILVASGCLQQEASFALEVGQMSGIVDSQSGSHIIISACLRVTVMKRKTVQFRGVLCLDPVICARLTFPVCHQFSVFHFYSALACCKELHERTPT